MKRIWICLLALLLLAGCGSSGTGTEEARQEEQTPSSGSYSLGLATEWDAYDPSVETIWCIVSSGGTGAPLEYGAEYRMDVHTDSGWEEIPLREDAAWDMVLYSRDPGESWAFACSLSLFDYDFTDGDYRVVK